MPSDADRDDALRRLCAWLDAPAPASRRRARSRRSRARSCGRGSRRAPVPAAAATARSADRRSTPPRRSCVTARLTSWPIRSISSNGPIRKAARIAHHRVDASPASAAPSASSAQRLAVERPRAAVDDEARRRRRVAPASCPTPRRSRRRSRRHPPTVASPLTTSTSGMQRRRIEEMHADDALGMLQARGERGDRQRRRVRWRGCIGSDDVSRAREAARAWPPRSSTIASTTSVALTQAPSAWTGCDPRRARHRPRARVSLPLRRACSQRRRRCRASRASTGADARIEQLHAMARTARRSARCRRPSRRRR